MSDGWIQATYLAVDVVDGVDDVVRVAYERKRVRERRTRERSREEVRTFQQLRRFVLLEELDPSVDLDPGCDGSEVSGAGSDFGRSNFSESGG
jgi:hypothetical protein